MKYLLILFTLSACTYERDDCAFTSENVWSCEQPVGEHEPGVVNIAPESLTPEPAPPTEPERVLY